MQTSSWTRYRKGLCGGCWASCCHDMPVQASVPDLIRLGFLTDEEAATSLPRAAHRLKREGIIRTFRSGSLVFILKQKKNKDCIFLSKERTCTVYERRPEICRQFPKIGPKPGFCPYRPK